MRVGTDVVHGLPTEMGATMVHGDAEYSVESDMMLLEKNKRNEPARQSHF